MESHREWMEGKLWMGCLYLALPQSFWKSSVFTPCSLFLSGLIEKNKSWKQRCKSSRLKESVFLLKDFLVKNSIVSQVNVEHSSCFTEDSWSYIVESFLLQKMHTTFWNCKHHLSLAFPICNRWMPQSSSHTVCLPVCLSVQLSVSPYGFCVLCSKSQAWGFSLSGEHCCMLGNTGSHPHNPQTQGKEALVKSPPGCGRRCSGLQTTRTCSGGRAVPKRS